MAVPALLKCLFLCVLVLGVADCANAQIPAINITALTEFLNEFFAALRKDYESSFPGVKLYVLKGKAENTGDYNESDDDDDDDDDHEAKLEITKYTFNNIVSFKFEAKAEDSKVRLMTIRQGLPTITGKVILAVPGNFTSYDGESSLTSWIVNASYVAAYNGQSVTTVIDAMYTSPYMYYLNATTNKGWRRGQMYKPIICFWCDY